MGVRESLLNTITSVADSDFVRIVTSAGASSKATVRNLFKGFESNLSAKSSLTNSDYIRVVGSDNEAYKQSVSAVKTAMGVDKVQLNLPSAFSVRGKTYAEHIEAQVNNNRLPYSVPFLGVCEFYENGMALIAGYIYISNSKAYGSVLVSGATATVSCRCIADTWTQVSL